MRRWGRITALEILDIDELLIELGIENP